MPGMQPTLTGGECGEHGKTSEKMRVPRQRVVMECARGLGQNHCESNEREGLPKLWRFEPDEKSEENTARSGEESAKGALLSIVA